MYVNILGGLLIGGSVDLILDGQVGSKVVILSSLSVGFFNGISILLIGVSNGLEVILGSINDVLIVNLTSGSISFNSWSDFSFCQCNIILSVNGFLNGTLQLSCSVLI